LHLSCVLWIQRISFICLFGFFLLSALPFVAGDVIVTVEVLNAAPIVSDGNISPTNWAGTGSVILGFQCSDPNRIADLNRVQATITGAVSADLNDLSYTVSGAVAIISTDINAYLTTKGTYYVTSFCIDDSNKVGAGSQITGNYVDVLTITIISPVTDSNINSSPTITFDVNKNTDDDVNGASISPDINGTKSTDFNYLAHCTEFSGEFHCSYTETGLTADADTNFSVDADNNTGQSAAQQSILIHYDATAPTIVSFSASKSGSDIFLSWNATDAFTGIEAYYVREDSGAWIPVTNTNYTYLGSSSASHTYYLKARDYADNNSLISSATYAVSVGPGPTTPTDGGPSGGGPGPSPLKPVEPLIEPEVFDINLIRIDDPIEAGERLDFTYLVANKTSINDNAYISYWLERDGAKLVSGSETVYLLVGEERENSEGLLLLDEMVGKYDFCLELTRVGQDPIVIQREIEIMIGAPTKIDLDLHSLTPGEEEEPLRFAIDLSSNRDDALPILVEQKIYKGNTVVWEKKQTAIVAVYERYFEEVYGLEPGIYTVEITSTYEGHVEKDVEHFERKREVKFAAMPLPVPPTQLLLVFFNILPLLILLLLITAMLLWYRLKSEPVGERSLKVKMAWITLALIVLALLVLIVLYALKDSIIGPHFVSISQYGGEGILVDNFGGLAVGVSSLLVPGFPADLIAVIAFLGVVLAFFLTFKGKRGSNSR